MSKSDIAANDPQRGRSAAAVNGVVSSGEFVGSGEVQSGSGATAGGITSGETVDGGGTANGGTSGGGQLSGGSAGGTSGGGGSTVGGSTGGGPVAGGGVAGGNAAGGSTASGGQVSVDGGPCTSKGAPIVIGQDGVFSGLLGQTSSGVKAGMSVWSRWVNDNGGIQCHPVVLYQTDDGSDPSKAAANINDLVKTKHAIALVGMNLPVVLASGAAAASKLGVPMVGGDLQDIPWWTDPNLFPNGGYSLSTWAGAMGEAVAATGKKKIASLLCVEATICQTIDKNFNAMVQAAKGTVIMRGSISLTQSDYTAECQNAKNAGAEILFVGADATSIQRLARSCKNIGYSPPVVSSGLAVSAAVLQDPNVQKMNFYVGDANASFLDVSTPGLKMVHDAFKKYTGSDVPDQPSMKGWASGMLFKAAIDKLGTAARQGPITTAMVFEGLYKLKNETAGGLMPPVNFIKGKPAPKVSCYSVFVVTTEGIKNRFPGFKCNSIR